MFCCIADILCWVQKEASCIPGDSDLLDSGKSQIVHCQEQQKSTVDYFIELIPTITLYIHLNAVQQ